MEHKIRALKEQLATTIEFEALTSKKVIRISHKLDELIVEYIKKFSGKTACKLINFNSDKSQP